jgi:16S rRNA (guanine(966)-N(2))-methyltransferase RsmD
VRESLFNILAPHIEGSVFVDLFAGTGAVGIEAISRGAAKAIFVEEDLRHAGILRENIEKCGFQKTARIIRGNAWTILRMKALPACDILFADPPYDFPDAENLLILLAHNVKIQKFICYEHAPKKDWTPPLITPLVFRRTYTYGDTCLSFFETEGVQS